MWHPPTLKPLSPDERLHPAVAVAALCLTCPAPAADRPNIVLITADDLGPHPAA